MNKNELCKLNYEYKKLPTHDHVAINNFKIKNFDMLIENSLSLFDVDSTISDTDLFKFRTCLPSDGWLDELVDKKYYEWLNGPNKANARTTYENTAMYRKLIHLVRAVIATSKTKQLEDYNDE